MRQQDVEADLLERVEHAAEGAVEVGRGLESGQSNRVSAGHAHERPPEPVARASDREDEAVAGPDAEPPIVTGSVAYMTPGHGHFGAEQPSEPRDLLRRVVDRGRSRAARAMSAWIASVPSGCGSLFQSASSFRSAAVLSLIRGFSTGSVRHHGSKPGSPGRKTASAAAPDDAVTSAGTLAPRGRRAPASPAPGRPRTPGRGRRRQRGRSASCRPARRQGRRLPGRAPPAARTASVSSPHESTSAPARARTASSVSFIPAS